MIRVGVVGASGWAGVSHLPALAGLAEFGVTAVATTNQASADKAAAAHGVPLAFGDAAALVAHSDVDLVVVSVKAPGHAAIIRAALEARKHVLSEWPLTVDHDEAGELAELAEAAGVVHAVCLQGYQSPDARFVADLIAEGRIGRLESAIMVASGAPLGGPSIPPELEWSTDPAGGTTVLTIMAGHFLATLERMAGELVEVSARLPRPHDRVAVAGTGRTVANLVPGHVLLHGTLRDGATASVAVHGGSGGPDGFLVKLVGSKGTLTVTPTEPGKYLHWTDWDIRVDGEPVKVPDTYRSVPFDPAAGPVANVAALYQEIARAIEEGRLPRPSFHTAARLHRLLAAIEAAALSGGTERIS
ncbi:Gfo/Idh/MocA family protein [Sphaerisporangium fuscum]|uniref:Gfo/Idh/MocA family protein n=1 Tax=Sphaerisporangium fuscum TaxID=2835868 RepID=UPI001BDD4655|nr:Gfo/Idh/MocA family oxidoreductase [Sphaerisporangium fuscum]